MTFSSNARGSSGTAGSGGGRRRLAGLKGPARLWMAVVASSALVSGVVAAAGPAGATADSAAVARGAGTAHRAFPVGYIFHTVRNHQDVTFNHLLGINKYRTIVGYSGSGARGHPNKGYVVVPPYRQADFRSENFPHSAQTQVTGLNNHGVTVGSWSRTNKASQVNGSIGFYARDHHFHSVRFPTHDNASPRVNQLLGVNDHHIAVGFYVNSHGSNRAYKYHIRTGRFGRVSVPGSVSTVATAINDKGSVAGYFTDALGVTRGFLLRRTGRLFILSAPGASTTTALGVSNHGEVVGAWGTGGGVSHGFTWTRRHGLITVDNPDGIGTTTINGVSNAGRLVGFFTNAAGNTAGMRTSKPIPAPSPG